MTEAATQRYFSGLSRSTFLLAFASFFSDVSTEMLYPVLPVFLTQILNANGSIVGLVDGFAQATQNIVQGFSGTLADKLQRRKPIALAGYRQAIARDGEGRVERHFVILPFAARWIAGEVLLNEELAEARWLNPAELSGLKTTEGLAQIVVAAGEQIAAFR